MCGCTHPSDFRPAPSLVAFMPAISLDHEPVAQARSSRAAGVFGLLMPVGQTLDRALATDWR
eukprot:4781232-Alexandrium_andersonii.AAC.1